MNLLICIDDTDSKTSEKGTGAIAEELMELIEKNFDGKTDFITRHQLLIHPDIPYTSHNSSMCFGCEVSDNHYYGIIEMCYEHLKKESAAESDPGIAVADIKKMNADLLIKYGKECKRKVVSIKSAYEIAKKANVYLNEAGGTGQGVIGAMAGIGLRCWGYDGTLKGGIKKIETETYLSAKQILSYPHVERIVDTNYDDLLGDELVFIGRKPKVVMYEGKLTVVTLPEEGTGRWKLLEKNKAQWLGGNMIFKEGCSEYKPDVSEERVDEVDGNCYNCLYRRWLENGILCQKPLE